MSTKFSGAAPAIGRLLLSAIFVMSGIHKLTAWQQTADQMQQEGMVAVEILLVGAIIFELGGGLSVLFGFKTWLGAFALIIFLIPTTLIFHDFWQYTGSAQQEQMIHFMKNLAIMGGLFALLGAGPGCCSIDRKNPEPPPTT